MPTPEDKARQDIDRLLTQAGWAVQDKNAVNLSASRGVAVRELSFKTGEPDYTLFVDGKAIGTVEAKPAGHSLTGVEEQSEKYVKGVPFGRVLKVRTVWMHEFVTGITKFITLYPDKGETS